MSQRPRADGRDKGKIMQLEDRTGIPGNGHEAEGRPRQDRDDGGFKVFDRRCSAQDSSGDAGASEERSEFPSYVEQLRQQLQEKDNQLREYIAAYKKEVVENLEQTKQRLARDAEQQTKALRAQIAEPMVEVLDALERSLVASQAHPDVATLRAGLGLVQNMLVQRLGLLGLERIVSVDQVFDPRLHEAVAVVPVDAPSQHNHVVAELSAGFSLDGRVVRAAKVQVGKWTDRPNER